MARSWRLRGALAALALAAAPARASITVYSQVPLGDATSTASAASATYTGAAAYDPTTLTPPAVPGNLSTSFALALQATGEGVPGLSIPLAGSFLGFSIEFSVINQVLGKNSSLINVPFLNLMANLATRGGAVHLRLGGNTQETAVLVDSLADGKILEKDYAGVSNPTDTPPLVFTPDVLYMMANISALVNTRWYLGIPFNDTSNLRLAIAEYGERILGDTLLGFQVGNEPDLYADHGHRNSTYGPYDYYGEFGVLVQALQQDTAVPTQNNLIAPNLATGAWTPEMVWDTGFLTTYASSLGALAVEHYPDNNCFAQYGIGSYRDPQTIFGNYLNHTAGQALVAAYMNSTSIAVAAGKPFIMFETNTASCGGFPGISDSFGSAMWGLDYALQMAYTNFSGAMFHVGGQNVYYNPFTAPPTNQSSFHQWTIGPVYYSSLVSAEVFGASNTSRIADITPDGAIYTPAYVVYEGDAPARVVLFNYVTDGSGASTVQVAINVPSAPSEVYVKYLQASSVSDKVGNITWAGQTFGGTFGSDGRLSGTLDVQTVQCNSGTCTISVPAPSVALVFLSQAAVSASGADQSSSVTFSTTAVTKTANTATIDASALATMNGMNGATRKEGSTSKGSASGAARAVVGAAVVGGALLAGAAVLVGW